MEYDNFEKVEQLVKDVKTQEELLEILQGNPTVTITKQYRTDDIILDTSRNYPEDFMGYAEDFIHSMKVNVEQKIEDIKAELKKL